MADPTAVPPHTEAPTTLLSTTRGKLVLALLCAVAFIDFVDASIVNIALPSIRRSLHFSEVGLQWVPSGYLLTYGGFMLLGGRFADLIGRRRVLVAGTVVIGIASLIGGLANSSGVLVGARLAQGLGASLMLPAALSILTTMFTQPSDRRAALGVWGGVGGLASAAGVLLGGLLTEGLGWRWVMFVNPIAIVFVLAGIRALIAPDARRPRLRGFDAPGALLVTGGMLLLVFALVRAPTVGWGATETIAELVGALVLLAAFVVNELRRSDPLAPLSIFRIGGLGYSNATQLIAFAGLIAMFFFLTLYMQNVLGYSPIQTGLAYLPLCFTIGIAAGISPALIARIGTRPLIVGGALISAGGVFWLSRIPVSGHFATDLLPGMIVLSLGFGPVFVAVTTAANDGVPADRAGLAASLLNASQQLGAALGLAIFTALAISRTNGLLADHVAPPAALTAGFSRGLVACSAFLVAAAVIGLRATQTRGENAGRSSDDPDGAERSGGRIEHPAVAGSRG
jgi:EmrB/QacA subfamily drug resistance transporter